MNSNNKRFLQISSGRGPAECCRVVALVLEKIMKQAKELNLTTEVIDREEGQMNRTLFSAILLIEGERVGDIEKEWLGTVQWISKSPYRIHHQRKNWFVGVNAIDLTKEMEANSNDFEYQTLRASSPGGQHVNKTESAVRAIHILSGLSVTASDQRSQLQNKKLATERLLLKLAAWNIEQAMQKAQENWSNHNKLERGNPVKVIKQQLN